MSRLLRYPEWIITLLLLAATVGLHWSAPSDAEGNPSAAAAPEKDRQAILRMAGCFKVHFSFRETLALQKDYKLATPYEEEALEWVQVVEEKPDFISLQHLLMDGGRVIKHWRQDWQWRNQRVHEYQGRNRWTPRALQAHQAAGSWTQKVYQTDDSPRYEAPGRWMHLGDASWWESDRTYRPLPRRELTTRSDYELLEVRNRQTITASGWLHEQDNVKLALDGQGKPSRALAREVGLNSYTRVEDSRGEAARKWWATHQRFWADANAVWKEIYKREQPLIFTSPAGAPSMGRAMASLDKELSQAATYDAAKTREQIRKTLSQYLTDNAAATVNR